MDKNYYKISPELKESIIKTAQECRELGCRKISALIQEQFKVDISKSSIAVILKAGFLNHPVGRRCLHKKSTTSLLLIANNQSPPPNPHPRGEGMATGLGMGCWFMKAADLCLSGREIISKATGARFKDMDAADLAAKNETLLYLAVFGRGLDGLCQEALNGLAGREFTKEEIKKYIGRLKGAMPLDEESLRGISVCCQEALALQCVLEDKSSFYIDAGGHSIWAGLRIPDQFSVGLHKAGERLNEIIEGERPVILQAAPGFEAPTPAFLNFIYSFQALDASKALSRIALVADDSKILSESRQLIPPKKRYFIFGLWPWQYQKFRAISSSGQIVLTEPATHQKITLRAITYESGREEALALLTNIEEDASDDASIRLLYGKRWPNLELGYQDFLEEIGHLSSRNNRKKAKIMSNIPFQGSNPLKLLVSWRQELNRYCQHHFFPASYNELNFAVLKERFYELRGQLIDGADSVAIIFYTSANFPYFEDLRYSCSRVNESDIRLADGRRLNFTCAPSIP